MMRLFRFLVLVTLMNGCSNIEYDMNDFNRLYGAPEAEMADLLRSTSEMKVFFGHQSVGGNIMSGIRQWEEETGVALNIIETRDFEDTGSSAFVHYRVGENGNPKLKVDDFVERVESIAEENGSVVFFKLCYVDITASTDVEELFEYYKEKMLYLKEQRPGCRLVLVTTPLTTIQKGIKAAAKKVLNREPAGVMENIRRNDFNDRIRGEFAGVFPVFDLAELESTLPDGTREIYKHEGNEYLSLANIYTNDGGHLNEFGARMVAYNLIAFLTAEMDSAR